MDSLAEIWRLEQDGGGFSTPSLDPMRNPISIPEIPIRFAAETAEAQAVLGFKWAGERAGARSKVGGSPDWLQTESVPTCTCGEPMTFHAQLDSLGDKVCLADVGMLYVFVCFDCFATSSVLQSS